MTTNKKMEELVLAMHAKAKEIMELAKEAGVEGDKYLHLAVGIDSDYIRVDAEDDELRYEICTIGDEKPKMRFIEV